MKASRSIEMGNDDAYRFTIRINKLFKARRSQHTDSTSSHIHNNNKILTVHWCNTFSSFHWFKSLDSTSFRLAYDQKSVKNSPVAFRVPNTKKLLKGFENSGAQDNKLNHKESIPSLLFFYWLQESETGLLFYYPFGAFLHIFTTSPLDFLRGEDSSIILFFFAFFFSSSLPHLGTITGALHFDCLFYSWIRIKNVGLNYIHSFASLAKERADSIYLTVRSWSPRIDTAIREYTSASWTQPTFLFWSISHPSSIDKISKILSLLIPHLTFA